MPAVQKTFTLVPQAPARQAITNHVTTPIRPMTSKQVQKAYKEKNREPRMSRAERIKQERAEQERIRKEFEKEKASAKAKLARERKKEKEEKEKQEKKKRGMPTVKVRPSQNLIVGFVRGKKRDCKGDVKGERKVEVVQEQPAEEGIAETAPGCRQGGCNTVSLEKLYENTVGAQTEHQVQEDGQLRNPAVSFDENLLLDDDELELEVCPEKASPVKPMQRHPDNNKCLQAGDSKPKPLVQGDHVERRSTTNSQGGQRKRLCERVDVDIMQALADSPDDLDEKSDVGPGIYHALSGGPDGLEHNESTETSSSASVEDHTEGPLLGKVSEGVICMEHSPKHSKDFTHLQLLQSQTRKSAPLNHLGKKLSSTTTPLRITSPEKPDMGSVGNKPNGSAAHLAEAMGPPPLPRLPPLSTQAILGSFDDFFPSSTQQALELEYDLDLPTSQLPSEQALYIPAAETTAKVLHPRDEFPEASPPNSPTPSPPSSSQGRFFTSSGTNPLIHLAKHRSLRDVRMEEIHRREQERLDAGSVLLQQQQQEQAARARQEAARNTDKPITSNPVEAAPTRNTRPSEPMQQGNNPGSKPLGQKKQASAFFSGPSHVLQPPLLPMAEKPQEAAATAGKENMDPAKQQDGNNLPFLSQETDYGGGWMDDEAVDSLLF